jgi:hypothetical protein
LKKEAGINKNNQFICFLKQKKLIEHEALYEERRGERREFPIISVSSNPSAAQLFKYTISRSFFLLYGINRCILFSFLYPHHRKLISSFSYIFLLKKKEKRKKKKETMSSVL